MEIQTMEEFQEEIASKSYLEQLNIAGFYQVRANFAKDYIEGSLRDHYKVLTGSRYGFDSFVVNDGFVTFYEEQNVACHCHPQMETKEHSITFDELAMPVNDYAKLLNDKRQKEALELAVKKANEKELKDSLEAERKLQQERKTYEELRKKFEQNNSPQ